MTKQIRQLGVALMVCFAVLFIQLNRLAVIDASKLNGNAYNTRDSLRDFAHARGNIVTADGVVIATSVPTDDAFKFQRQYPEGPLFAGITGFFARDQRNSGVEETYNDQLAGRTLDISLQDIGDLFVDQDRVADVELTVRADLQRIAAEKLGTNRGAVVALDPRTGGILALVSNPTFDPNVLADHDRAKAVAAKTALDQAEDKPRLSRAFQYADQYFPGSTFKIVTSTAGLTSGTVTVDTQYPVRPSYTAPDTDKPIRNFDGDTCGGKLFEALRVSCNAVFAEMGVQVGAAGMIRTAEGFGFNDQIPIDLPGAQASQFPKDFTRNQAGLAQAAIGQNSVQATPLQMALVAAAVANEGKIMRPHVMRDIRDSEGNVVDEYSDERWRTAMDPGTAGLLRQAMLGVVQSGTATRLKVAGQEVGGKTGTAQIGLQPPSSNAWIIGFAGPPGGPAEIAVAVIVEAQPEVSNATGGRVAAPIAQAVLQTYFDSKR